MAVVKVIEVMANSPKSWEDAAKNAVAHASKSVKNIRSVYVQEQTCVISGNEISEYRVNVKISFDVN